MNPIAFAARLLSGPGSKSHELTTRTKFNNN